MALHHRSVEPQARQACYGRGHPVNDSDVTEHHRPPATTLTVFMPLDDFDSSELACVKPMDHRGHRGVSVEHAREAYDLRRLPGTVARPPRTRSSGALPVGMRACGSAGEHAPAHGRPSTAPPMFERVGIPDVFALDHSGAGILRLRHHRRPDPWVLTNPSAALKSLMPTGTSHGVTPDEQRPPPVAPSLPPRVACSSRPATGTSWAGSPSVLRRRARGIGLVGRLGLQPDLSAHLFLEPLADIFQHRGGHQTRSRITGLLRIVVHP